ncbi:hypothetical protein ON010_g13664 [Phytophthora cinnamomi]|nr:hypothetical protein ON010_g13664 [Phytophthora cinnamomi]
MAPSLMATVCTALWFSPTTDPKQNEAASTDSDDEWGIVHAPKVHSARPQPSRVHLNSTSHGIEVSLVLSVAACHRAPSNLRLQRSQVTWTFSTVSTLYPRCSLVFVQVPAFALGLVMLSQLDAYVMDRLELAARRHVEWTKGSTLTPSPRITPVAANASGIATTPLPVRTDESAAKATQQNTTSRNSYTRAILRDHELTARSHHRPCQSNGDQRHTFQAGCAPLNKMKRTRLPRMQRFTAEARYMNYEQSVSYTRRRQVNIERRRVLQSLSTTNPVDSRCVSRPARRSDRKHLATP